nr:NUDIX domain-containing protein [Kineosporia babensis]
MASWTASGAQWLFPGGTMEPPAEGQPLSEKLLRIHAARELAEETGISTDPADLRRWALVRNPNGNIGFFYSAPALTEDTVRQVFTRHLAGQQQRGEPAELTHLHFAAAAHDLDALDAPVAETVPALLARYNAVANADLDREGSTDR